MHWVSWERFSSLANKALQQGATFSKTKVEWDISLGCHKPYYAEIGSCKPEPWRYYKWGFNAPEWMGTKYLSLPIPQEKIIVPDGQARFIIIATACRKCEQCLINRRKLWSSRARQEIQISTRTWFGTLTINPHWRFILSARSGSKNFHHSYREVGKEVTKYFKRLRKSGHKFRYLMVMEAHKDGYPHVHLLIHEGDEPLPKRELQCEWQLGYSSFKLVDKTDAKAAFYVTKYISKDARTRLRASQKYGKSGND